jgi:dihydroorotate dehydrogenase
VLYKFIFDVFFRRVDPEAAHHLGMFVIRLLGATSISSLLKVSSAQRVDAMGLKFDSVFGLAAGFDKNAHAVKALGDLGFSHVEVGTVTAIAQSGNDKPRLFRLIEDRALINRMGFNNDGAEKIAARLAKTRQRYGSNLPIIGINIGKSRVVEVDDAVDDYRKSARMLAGLADYLAVNVSSPNTPGLRSLQTVKALRPILEAVIDESLQKPVLVKIAPDLEDKEIVAVAKLAKELKSCGDFNSTTFSAIIFIFCPLSFVFFCPLSFYIVSRISEISSISNVNLSSSDRCFSNTALAFLRFFNLLFVNISSFLFLISATHSPIFIPLNSNSSADNSISNSIADSVKSVLAFEIVAWAFTSSCKLPNSLTQPIPGT